MMFSRLTSRKNRSISKRKMNTRLENAQILVYKITEIKLLIYQSYDIKLFLNTL